MISKKLCVVKIGGSLLKDSKSYLESAQKIKEIFIDNNYKTIIVVSAVKGVTDRLINVARGSQEALEFIAEKYLEIARELNSTKIIRRVYEELERLKKVADAINGSGVDLSLYDMLLSFGERISKIVMVGALEIVGVSALELNADSLIITNDVFSDASIDYISTSTNLEKLYSSIIDSPAIPVIEGFIGSTIDGRVTTLGRGGSDYTATTIASLLNIDEVYLVTDVDGIMTADPDIINSAKLVKTMSYKEALEASLHGAKRINPKAFEPLEKFYSSRIIIGSWSRFGTEIVKEIPVELYGPKVIMDKESQNISYIAIVGEGTSTTRFIKKIIEIIDKNNIDVLGIQSYIYRPSLLIYIDSGYKYKTLHLLHRELFEVG
uniref:Aspartokinase n=1 Tax=Ignisphaera aggregans TaxID=334771 RepID=A0A7C5XM62_9CREN